jgi:hypothetical protein
LIAASPATSTASTSRQIHAVVPQRLESHPAVMSFANSMAQAMAMTESGDPGKSTTIPRTENHAAAPARATAAT